MSTVTLTADDGTQHVGKLPTSWADTPLAPYAALAAATTLPDRIRATATLVGLPAEPLLADVQHFAAIAKAAPFLFGDELPEATGPVPSFQHLGTTYLHVGNLDKVNAEQLEALLNFLREHEGQPLAAGPSLLGVLYCAKGKAQTAEVVAAAAEAFATLPMSVAWPALAFFLSSTAPASLRIRTASALNAQAQQLLTRLAQAMETAGASSTFWQKVQRWLFRRWLRNARKMLLMS